MIAVVVVTFSAPAPVLDRCLRRMIAEGGVDRLIVIDTGGAGMVAADLDDMVDLVAIENRGYGAAANRGFELARSSGASMIALLNDDAVVGPGWLDPLVDALADDDVGAAQPMLVDDERGVVTSLGVRFDRYGAGTDIGDGEPMPVDRSVREIEMFTGGAVLFDAAFLADTGGFDERYFLYYEDVDLSLRGRALGWRYVVVPASEVEHRRGTSTSGLPDRTRFLQERNRLWTSFRFSDAATVGRGTWLSIRRLRHQPRCVHARSLLTGLAGAPRRLIERARAGGPKTEFP